MPLSIRMAWVESVPFFSMGLVKLRACGKKKSPGQVARSVRTTGRTGTSGLLGSARCKNGLSSTMVLQNPTLYKRD